MARLRANVMVVMLGPKLTSSASVAPSRSAVATRTSWTSSSVSKLAAKAPAVVGVAGEEVVVDGAQAGVHDLRPGRSVEPGDGLPVGPGPAQRGKAGADGGDIPVSHGPESRRAAGTPAASGYRARVAGPGDPPGTAQESQEARRVTDEQRPAGGGPEIEHLMAEGRTFPPDPAFRAAANAGPDLYARAEEDPEAFWADLARREAALDGALHADAELGAALRPLVRGRQAQRLRQLPRPPRRGRPRRQGRLPLDRRAGRHAHADLRRPPSRGPEGRQRPPRAGHPDAATVSPSTCP